MHNNGNEKKILSNAIYRGQQRPTFNNLDNRASTVFILYHRIMRLTTAIITRFAVFDGWEAGKANISENRTIPTYCVFVETIAAFPITINFTTVE